MKKKENKEHLWGRNLEFSKFVLLQLNMSPDFDLIAGGKNSIQLVKIEVIEEISWQ